MLTVRTMDSSEREEVAALIFNSTNAWYQKNRGFDALADPAGGRQIVETYELLDPGCTLVVYDDEQKRIAGSCFYHPRPTHVSLGILNSHPDYAGQGAAKMLAARIAEIAAEQNKPLRLVSSAMNLDSFSVYSRLGFVPTEFFQDTILTVPSEQLCNPWICRILVPVVRACSGADFCIAPVDQFSLRFRFCHMLTSRCSR